MPRFFIDVDDGENFLTDAVGLRCDSEDQAISTAIIALRRSIESGVNLEERRIYRMSIRDRAGEVIFETCLTVKAVPLH